MKIRLWIVPGLVLIFAAGVFAWSRLHRDPENYFYVIEHDGPAGTIGCEIIGKDNKVERRLPGSYCTLVGDGSFYLDYNAGVSRIDRYDEVQWKTAYRVHHNLNVEPETQNAFFPSFEIKKVGDKRVHFNFIRGLSPEGELIFNWAEEPRLEEIARLSGLPLALDDYPHTEFDSKYYNMNGVDLIPHNALENQNPAFRAGNLIVTYPPRLILILDRKTGDIVYHLRIDQLFPAEMEAQDVHTASVDNDGNILFFLNNVKLDGENNSSLILKVAPTTRQILYRYPSDPAQLPFYSDARSSVYQVDHGNYLVSVSADCRVFEMNPSGKILWQHHSARCTDELVIFYAKKFPGVPFGTAQ